MTKEQFEAKVEKAKRTVKQKATNAWMWCNENKDLAIVVIPAVIGGTVKVIQIVSRCGRVREEQRLKENYIYDRKNGHYVEARRKLKSSEWIELDARREMGQSIAEALADMKLLK